MRKSRFTEVQIMGILRQAEGGLAVADLCREHAISAATLSKWRSKYGGMDASMISDKKAIFTAAARANQALEYLQKRQVAKAA